MLRLLERVVRFIRNFYQRKKNLFWTATVTVFLLFILWWLGFSYSPLLHDTPISREKITYSDFWNYFRDNRIQSITFYVYNRRLVGTIRQSSDMTPMYFEVIVPPAVSDSLQRVFARFAAEKENSKTRITFVTAVTQEEAGDSRLIFRVAFWYLFAAAFFGGVIWYMTKHDMHIGHMMVHQNTGKEIGGKKKITFADVGGIDEARQEVEVAVEFLKNPAKFTVVGARMPRGYLLVGPPGTGKTLLAKAVAGEADRPFFSIAGSEFVELFVGVGPARVRNLFTKAREKKPSIIFIDDLDSVGRARGISKINSAGNQEYENTLLQLLVEMDGIETSEGVVVFGATNAPERLDQALIRPGRFDRHITVNKPDVRGRETILKIHTSGVTMKAGLDLKEIAKSIPGFVGADIANLVNEAALLTARRGGSEVNESDFNKARDRVVEGTERHILMSPEEKKLIAYHEAGHTIAALFTSHADPVYKVTIVAHGMALGSTLQIPPDDRNILTEPQIQAQLVTAFAGREAEKLVSNVLSTGAHHDLLRSTNLARKMVCEWGMSDTIGPIVYITDQNTFLSSGESTLDCSSETRHQIEQEIKWIVVAAERKAHDLIARYHNEVQRLAQTLLEKETLDRKEIYNLVLGE